MIRGKIAQHMRYLGTGHAITWHQQQRKETAKQFPLHLRPEVIRSVNIESLGKLDMKSSMRMKLESHVMPWVAPSPMYQQIADNIHLIERDIYGMISKQDAQDNVACGKMHVRSLDEPILAWCNSLERVELEKQRRRQLTEPTINDIIDKLNMPISVKYVTKDSVRRGVLKSQYGYQADMIAWFDQLPLDKRLSKFFGIRDSDGAEYCLDVVPMGFKPACVISHTILEAIAPSALEDLAENEAECLFVDNSNLMGTREQCLQRMEQMQQRARAVGAKMQIANSSGQPEQQYEFLGEAYDHVNKTRCLTKRFTEKLRQIESALTRESRKFTAKEIFGIVGTLAYGAEVLDINLAPHITLLSEHSAVAKTAAEAGTWFHRSKLTPKALHEATTLLQQCSLNVPVHVLHGRRSATESATSTKELEIFVDASAWGWGAIVIDGASIKHISTPWTNHDHLQADAYQGDLRSSVTAEPFALRKVLCTVPLSQVSKLTIHTDHEPLVWTRQKRYSLTPSYNKVLDTIFKLEQAGITIELKWIPGTSNPADHLSRGTPPSPPLLPVTSIGGRRCNQQG